MARPEFAGPIYPKRGLLILGDAQIFDEAWVRPEQAQSSYVVDFTGQGSEYFAKRFAGSYPSKELADGTWRLVVPDTNVAQIIGDEARVHASREGWASSKIVVEPLNCSRMRALDAVRAEGFGMIGAGRDAYAALDMAKYMHAELWIVKDLAGRVTELRIKLPAE